MSVDRCARCLLPDTYPQLSFDDGVCSQCRNPPAPYQARGVDDLRELVDRYRKSSGYECIVALSGGRDSSFALDFAVNELKLRVLAVTYDNGYMPEQTRQNILSSVSRLGVDHEFCPDSQPMDSVASFLKAFSRKPDPALVAFICNGCMAGMMQRLYGAARRHGVHLILSGGGEPEKSFAEPLLQVEPGRLGRRWSLVLGAATHLLSNPRYLLRPRMLMSFVREAYARFYLTSGEDVTYVSLFHYLAWDEEMIEERIANDLGWRRPDGFTTNWRSDCEIHLIKQYLYRELVGFTKNDEILSNMVRSGAIDRQVALERLGRENDLPETVINAFMERHGVDVARLTRALARHRNIR